MAQPYTENDRPKRDGITGNFSSDKLSNTEKEKVQASVDNNKTENQTSNEITSATSIDDTSASSDLKKAIDNGDFYFQVPKSGNHKYGENNKYFNIYQHTMAMI